MSDAMYNSAAQVIKLSGFTRPTDALKTMQHFNVVTGSDGANCVLAAVRCNLTPYIQQVWWSYKYDTSL